MCPAGLFAIAQELQQEHEHIDKVEIEAQRPHNRGFVQPFLIAMHGMVDILLFDGLGVIGCQTCEDQHAQDGDCEMDRG